MATVVPASLNIGPLEWLALAVGFAMPLIVLICVAKRTSDHNRESERLRIEMSKMAGELEQLRKIGDGFDNDPAGRL